MGADAVSKAVKPQLRGLLHNSIKTNLIAAIVLSAAGAIALKVFVGDARKKRYAEFYKNYDAQKSFERMKAAGVMSVDDV